MQVPTSRATIMNLPSLDNIAFYWFGWKDYKYAYKPSFQIMKELYQEDQEARANGYHCHTASSSLLDKYYANANMEDEYDRIAREYSMQEVDQDTTDYGEDDLEEEAVEVEETNNEFYDQSIYKKFSYS